jgi:hypothetical protein
MDMYHHFLAEAQEHAQMECFAAAILSLENAMRVASNGPKTARIGKFEWVRVCIEATLQLESNAVRARMLEAQRIAQLYQGRPRD